MTHNDRFSTDSSIVTERTRKMVLNITSTLAILTGLLLAAFGLLAVFAPGGVTAGLDLMGLGGLFAIGGIVVREYVRPTPDVADLPSTTLTRFIALGVVGVYLALVGHVHDSLLFVLFASVITFGGWQRMAVRQRRKDAAKEDG